MTSKKVMLINFFPFINSSGGAEKVCCSMANALWERGFVIDIVCNDDQQGRAFYPLNEKIEITNLGCKNNIKMPCYLKLQREIRKIFIKNRRLNCCDEYKYNFWAKKLTKIIQEKEPEVIVCFDMEAAHALAKIENNSAKKIFMLHMNSTGFKEYLLEDEQHIKVLNTFDIIQVLFLSHKLDLENIINTKIVVIPNVVPDYSKDSPLEERQLTIMNLARICQEKGQEILIEAFAIIAPKYPQWQLKLYGKLVNEKYFRKLQFLIEKNSLEKQVIFAGVTEVSEQELKKAKIFVFPSLNEGFPLALTEAMSAEVPCVGFKDCAGVKDLLVDGQTGILVDRDAQQLAEALEKLIKDRKLAKEIAVAGKQSIRKYSAEHVWSMWENLIRGL